MFIYNFKINGTKVFKTFFSIVILLVIGILAICVYRIFNGAGNATQPTASTNNTIIKIKDEDYTNFLDAVCNNIDSYVGQKITYTGYIYRINDIEANQFILARNMLISNDSLYVVVGFLCECENATNFPNNSWVEIIGEIQKGAYHGNDMPILKITEIHNSQKPTDDYVNPPNKSHTPSLENSSFD